jgi:rod shape determining protein RodA
MFDSFLFKKIGFIKADIDWKIFLPALFLCFIGLITMKAFVGDDYFFIKQAIWLIISISVFIFVSSLDFRFLKKTSVVVTIFVLSFLLLLALFVLGKVSKGAMSWFDFGALSFQPSDPIKLALIILLAKYFSRRHMEIANVRHIFVSGFYAFSIFALVFLQPDFGSALIIFFIWLGMILVSGISKKHLALVFITGSVVFMALWGFVLHDYQKKRVMTFLNPLSDVRGSGYSAYQSTIAVGSGQVLGKGVGYGTQSKLKFLPEYHTDFIFAAFAEEWGFVGVTILFTVFGILIFGIIQNAYLGATNFEILFSLGVAILFVSHFIVNVGMNIGLMPVTGITFPFMSYGGTNLLASFTALGVVMGMRKYKKAVHRDSMNNEFLGLQ